MPDPSFSFVEPWLEFVSYMLSLPDRDLPQTISISYGENEQEIPKAYAKSVCNMFGQLGARGVSVLVASGE
jgi:tripeptidyl-peptidase I